VADHCMAVTWWDQGYTLFSGTQDERIMNRLASLLYTVTHSILINAHVGFPSYRTLRR